MNMSRKLAYNKKRGTFNSDSECRLIMSYGTPSAMKECHFFITATNKDRRNKMIAM